VKRKYWVIKVKTSSGGLNCAGPFTFWRALKEFFRVIGRFESRLMSESRWVKLIKSIQKQERAK